MTGSKKRRDRDQERLDRLEELYDNGREALDDEKYEQARDKFAALAKANGPLTDAALYWQAYADQRLGQRQAALAALADLKARFPQSRWQRDAGALEIEVRQSTGQPSRPEEQGDEELKMLAIQGLMNSDPERAMPLLEKVLQGPASPKEKSKAMFVLAQSGSPQGREIIGRIARGQSNPELQKKAVEYLAIFGGPEARKTMAEIYASTSDPVAEALHFAKLHDWRRQGAVVCRGQKRERSGTATRSDSPARAESMVSRNWNSCIERKILRRSGGRSCRHFSWRAM